MDSKTLLESLKQDLLRLLEILGLSQPIPPVIPPIQPVDPPQPVTPPIPSNESLLPWGDPVANRHNVRVIADQEGLTPKQKDDFSSTIHCESDYDLTIVMLNCEKAFVRSTAYNPTIHGAILSKDVGICQINTYWHIGPEKDFPSEEYVLQNPEAVVRWAARIFKTSPRTWVCFSKGLYKSYTP